MQVPWFGLKSSFFLFLLNAPLYLFVWDIPLPYVGLVSGLTYLLAYFLACGRFFAPVVIYAAGASALLANVVFGEVRVLGGKLVELYFLVALAASLIYASTFSRGVGRFLSVVLLLASVALGGVFMVIAAAIWRAAVPTLGFAPWLPEPQDAPIYVALYERWRRIHTYPKNVRCGKQGAISDVRERREAPSGSGQKK